jgi:enoyl-CoA hydratase
MTSDVTIRTEAHVAQVILDRPPVNALTRDSMAALVDAFDEVGSTPGVRAAVLSSSGRVFCAGSDVKARAVSAPGAGDETAYNRLARELNSAIADCAVPVVSAVQGPALGGGLCLVAASDLVVIGPDAAFGLPEIGVGLLGGGVWAARLFGARWARRMMLTGERIPAAQLLASGSFDAVETADDPVARALELAAGIAAKSPTAARLAKRALNDVEFMELRAGYRHEQTFTARLRAHPDSAEAMAAFTEHREPRFDD